MQTSKKTTLAKRGLRQSRTKDEGDLRKMIAEKINKGRSKNSGTRTHTDSCKSVYDFAQNAAVYRNCNLFIIFYLKKRLMSYLGNAYS